MGTAVYTIAIFIQRTPTIISSALSSVFITVSLLMYRLIDGGQTPSVWVVLAFFAAFTAISFFFIRLIKSG